MKKNFKNLFAVVGAAMMVMSTVVGCGSGQAEDTQTAEEPVQEASEAVASVEEATAEENQGAPYFTKGVYVNYALEAESPTRDYFYVFQDETYGHTDDAAANIGVPFDCTQEDGQITFSFGGSDEEFSDVLTISKVQYGIIYGHFEDGLELVFEPVEGVDADTFSAINYVSPMDEQIYEDPNGWSVKYNAELVEVNQSDNIVTFVYTGESAGTNMVTVTYDISGNAEEVSARLAESYGENATTTKSIFPGTEDVDGYWVTLPPAEDGSGLYQTAIVRDYMDGSLVFELTGHNSGDDEMDMAVSDTLAQIIDSLTFMSYGE